MAEKQYSLLAYASLGICVTRVYEFCCGGTWKNHGKSPVIAKAHFLLAVSLVALVPAAVIPLSIFAE